MNNILTTFIPVAYVAIAQGRLAKFAAKFSKKNLPIPVLSLTGNSEDRLACDQSYMHDDHFGCPTAKWVEVSIDGDVPKHSGWRLIASVANLNGTPVFMTVPGESVSIERMKNINPQACDHCRIDRTRNETHLIQHDDGRVSQMGSTCIKDFLGWDVSSVVSYWNDLNKMTDDDDDRGYGGYVVPEYSVQSIIRVACDVVSVEGKYRKSEYPDSTRGTVMDIIDPPRGVAKTREYAALVAKYKSQPDRSAAVYEATMQAWSEVTNVNASEWLYNLSIILNQEKVTSRYIGILVSIVTMGLRRLDAQAAAPKVAAPNVERVWLGDVNGKVAVDVTVTDVKYIDSDYGGSHLITMQDKDGNLLKWFASTLPTFEDGRRFLGKNMSVTVKGTVKKHDTYNGVKSTVLTRCKMEVI